MRWHLSLLKTQWEVYCINSPETTRRRFTGSPMMALCRLALKNGGAWKGGPDAPFYFSPDHLQCANMFHMGEVWYDVEGHFLKMASSMKAGQ